MAKRSWATDSNRGTTLVAMSNRVVYSIFNSLKSSETENLTIQKDIANYGGPTTVQPSDEAFGIHGGTPLNQVPRNRRRYRKRQANKERQNPSADQSAPSAFASPSGGPEEDKDDATSDPSTIFPRVSGEALPAVQCWYARRVPRRRRCNCLQGFRIGEPSTTVASGFGQTPVAAGSGGVSN